MQQSLLRAPSLSRRRLVMASVAVIGVVAAIAASLFLRTDFSHLFLPGATTTSDPPAMSPSEVAARALFVVLWPASLPESVQYAGGDVGPSGSHALGTGIEKGAYASFSWTDTDHSTASPSIRLVEAKGRYPSPRGQRIHVRGQTGGLMTTGSQESPGGNNAVCTIVWYENGLTLSVQGSGVSQAQLQQVAESLQPMNRPTTISFQDKSAELVEVSRAIVGALGDFPVPSVTHFADLTVYVVHTDLGFMAVVDDNPRLHAPTAWNVAAQTFISPAGGEEYDWEGNCIGGPYPRGLDRFPVRIEGDQVVVDRSTRLPGNTVGDAVQRTATPHPPALLGGAL